LTQKGKFASPRKRKSTTDVLNEDVKRGKYESLTTELNPRKRKSTNDIFNNVNVKKVNMICGLTNKIYYYFKKIKREQSVSFSKISFSVFPTIQCDVYIGSSAWWSGTVMYNRH